MTRSWTSRVLLPLLALSILTSSCADPGPAPLYGPRFNAATADYTAVQGEDGDGMSVSRIIGPEGGSLAAGGHVLVVPAGAVTGPTTFAMRLTDPTAISVELTATSLRSRDTNNVGARGFQQPLALHLSFETATRNVNPGRLTVAWARSDGGLEVVPSSVDMAEKIVTGQLRHFSGYVLVD